MRSIIWPKAQRAAFNVQQRPSSARFSRRCFLRRHIYASAAAACFLVDAGETAEQAACREAQEEAKITLSRLEPVTRAYSSTGSSTEFSHIFIGIADLNGAGAVAGVASPRLKIKEAHF